LTSSVIRQFLMGNLVDVSTDSQEIARWRYSGLPSLVQNSAQTGFLVQVEPSTVRLVAVMV